MIIPKRRARLKGIVNPAERDVRGVVDWVGPEIRITTLLPCTESVHTFEKKSTVTSITIFSRRSRLLLLPSSPKV